MAADAESVPAEAVMTFVSRMGNYRVVSVTDETNKRYEGRMTGEIASAEGREPIDVMLDLALADDLMTVFAPQLGGHDHASYELRSKLWRDDRTLIGASDAGAHLDMIDTFSFSTTVLQDGVRKHGVIGLEEAVHLITERPARYAGLIDRGLLRTGYHADIVVFDRDTVGRGPTYNRFDVPGNQFRVYADAEGVHHVFVNGVQIVRDGEHTGKLPGTVLKSGRDTRTVAMDAMRHGASN